MGMMMTADDVPLDVLDTAKGDRVIAELKGGETVSETYSHSTCI